MERFEQLDAWKLARELTKQIYSATRERQFSRDFALRDQIRRAAISVMSNIAEGFERNNDKEFRHFLRIAKGSAGEVRSQLFAAFDQNYLDESAFREMGLSCVRVSEIITGLIRYLSRSIDQEKKN